MKTGYSILLSELIKADKVDYSDCKFYQIVCPSCYEPVFKVKREEVDLHYLSHYKGTKTKEETEICELRVKNLAESDFEAKILVSREQKLSFFLSVFKEMVDSEKPANYVYLDENIKALKTSKGYKVFEENIKKEIFTNISKIEFKRWEKSVINSLSRANKIPKTSFSVEKQKEIAWDMMQLLKTSKAKFNLSYLLRYSFAITLANIQSNKIPNSKEINDYIEQIVFMSNKKKAQSLITEMMKYSNEKDGNSYFEVFLILIVGYFIKTLLSLPYFEFMKGIETTTKSIH